MVKTNIYDVARLNRLVLQLRRDYSNRPSNWVYYRQDNKNVYTPKFILFIFHCWRLNYGGYLNRNATCIRRYFNSRCSLWFWRYATNYRWFVRRLMFYAITTFG